MPMGFTLPKIAGEGSLNAILKVIEDAINGALVPGSSAGGDLTGTYPDPLVSKLGGRTITDVIWSDDARLTNPRTPSGAAGGDLSGSFPNPTVKPSVALSGSPTSPNPTVGDNSTKIATTKFVTDAVAAAVAGAGPFEGSALLWHVGTTPPGSPTNGMLWLYQGSGFYWMFIYDSSETTYKWKFVGGSPLIAYGASAITGSLADSTWTAIAGDVSLSTPRSGDYTIEFGGSVYPVSSGATTWLGVRRASTDPTVDGIASAGAYSGVASARQPLNSKFPATLTAADALALRYRHATGSTQSLTAFGRYLSILPARVS